MVAKIASGKSIRGALSYNENKVANGNAVLLSAINYPKDGEALSFQEKLARLTNQAALNERIQHKCVHISLNFDPSEHFDTDKYQAIAEAYMKKLGFGEQPYLVYQHTDAAHEHLHIVTMTIREDGSAVRLHNLASRASEPARKSVEKEFGLIRAESKKQPELFMLKPADLEKGMYGKSQTKQVISTIVRSVVKHYKFSSLPELNAVLQQFNLVADQGEPGTSMHDKGGLVYSLLDEAHQKTGVPIKASSIYDKPTLKNLQAKFENNRSDRQPYKARIKQEIEKLISLGVDMNRFQSELKLQGIATVLRHNPEGKLYGVTYVDHTTCTVFNGSELGKSHAASGLVSRLLPVINDSALAQNRMSTEQVLAATDFSKGVTGVLTQWAMRGMLVDVPDGEERSPAYRLGWYASHREEYWPLSYKMNAYLQVNNISRARVNYLRKALQEIFSHEQRFPAKQHQGLAGNLMLPMRSVIDECFRIVETGDYLSSELLREAKKKQKRRRG